MTEQSLHRFEDARPHADIPLRQPLVSLDDMQQFQRNINDRGRADLPASVNVSYIDFGLSGNLYNGSHSLRPGETQSRPEVDGALQGDQRADVAESPLSGQTLGERRRLLQEVERMPAHLRNAVRRDIDTLESRDRQLLVAGIFDNTAHPRDIDQGNFNTCNVTTIEERFYTLNPERAAELVAQVGLTGRYIGVEADGPMFGNRRPIRGPQGHVINIVGYDAQRRTVQISDQHGRRSDLQNVGINDLFLSMIPRRSRPQN